jgi:hypothetical protein
MAKTDNLSIAKVASSNNIKLGIGQFLDDFRLANDKRVLIKDEPAGGEARVLCLLAAIAHKLANDNGLDPPGWVFKPEYVFPQPAYTFDTQNEEYQKVLRETSPPEFAQRNIFYGANVLSRV